ncbi:hypothetical protein BsWGS_15145 [Bradybaena similaris]
MSYDQPGSALPAGHGGFLISDGYDGFYSAPAYPEPYAAGYGHYYNEQQVYPAEAQPGFPLAGAQPVFAASMQPPQGVPPPQPYTGATAVEQWGLPPIARGLNPGQPSHHGGDSQEQANVDSTYSISYSRSGERKSQATGDEKGSNRSTDNQFSSSSRGNQISSRDNYSLHDYSLDDWRSSHESHPRDDRASSRESHPRNDWTSSLESHSREEQASSLSIHSHEGDEKKSDADLEADILSRLNIESFLQDERLRNALFAGISKATKKLEHTLKSTDKKLKNDASVEDYSSRPKPQQSAQTSSADAPQKLKTILKRAAGEERVEVESKTSTDPFSNLSALDNTSWLHGKTSMAEVVRASEKGNEKPPSKTTGALRQLESYNDIRDEDYGEKDTKTQTKTKNAQNTQPFWSVDAIPAVEEKDKDNKLPDIQEQMYEQWRQSINQSSNVRQAAEKKQDVSKVRQGLNKIEQSPNLAASSQASKVCDKNEEKLDSTVHNILQSVGYNVGLSKRMQELTYQKKQQEGLHMGMINQSSSFLGQSEEIVQDVRQALFSDKQQKAQAQLDSLIKKAKASIEQRSTGYERSASPGAFSAETLQGKQSITPRGESPKHDSNRMDFESHETRSEQSLTNPGWEELSPEEYGMGRIESRKIMDMMMGHDFNKIRSGQAQETLKIRDYEIISSEEDDTCGTDSRKIRRKRKRQLYEKHAKVRQQSFSRERDVASPPHSKVLLEEAQRFRNVAQSRHAERFRDEQEDEYFYPDDSEASRTITLLQAQSSKPKEIFSSSYKSLKPPLQSGSKSSCVENLRVTSRAVHDDIEDGEHFSQSRRVIVSSKSGVRIAPQSPVLRRSHSPEVPRKRPASPLRSPVPKERRVFNEKQSSSDLHDFLIRSLEQNAPEICQALGLDVDSFYKSTLAQSVFSRLNVGGLSVMSDDHFRRDGVRKSPDSQTSRSPDRLTLRSPGRQFSRSPERHKSGLSDKWMSRSPDGKKSMSPFRQVSRSPVQLISRSPDRYKSKSPDRYKSRSPDRYKSRSPDRYKSRSPDRYKSRSPDRQVSQTLDRRQSRSPYRWLSRSPDRQKSRLSDSRMSKSPDGQMFRSPGRQVSHSSNVQILRSPYRQRSMSPAFKASKSSDRQKSRSPARFIATPPVKVTSPSPTRHKPVSPGRHGSQSSASRRSKSPARRRSRSPRRRRSKSPRWLSSQARSPGRRKKLPERHRSPQERHRPPKERHRSPQERHRSPQKQTAAKKGQPPPNQKENANRDTDTGQSKHPAKTGLSKISEEGLKVKHKKLVDDKRLPAVPIKQPLEEQQKELTKVPVKELPNEQDKEPQKEEQQHEYSETKELKQDIKVAADKLAKFPVHERRTILMELMQMNASNRRNLLSELSKKQVKMDLLREEIVKLEIEQSKIMKQSGVMNAKLPQLTKNKKALASLHEEVQRLMQASVYIPRLEEAQTTKQMQLVTEKSKVSDETENLEEKLAGQELLMPVAGVPSGSLNLPSGSLNLPSGSLNLPSANLKSAGPTKGNDAGGRSSMTKPSGVQMTSDRPGDSILPAADSAVEPVGGSSSTSAGRPADKSKDERRDAAASSAAVRVPTQEKVYYEYIDSRNHWCSSCSCLLGSLEQLLQHMHSKKHCAATQLLKKAWKIPEEKQAKPKVGLSRSREIKGGEMFYHVDGYYCKLCQAFCGDVTDAIDHLKDDRHYDQYMEFVRKNPLYERTLLLEKKGLLVKNMKPCQWTFPAPREAAPTLEDDNQSSDYKTGSDHQPHLQPPRKKLKMKDACVGTDPETGYKDNIEVIDMDLEDEDVVQVPSLVNSLIVPPQWKPVRSEVPQPMVEMRKTKEEYSQPHVASFTNVQEERSQLKQLHPPVLVIPDSDLLDIPMPEEFSPVLDIPMPDESDIPMPEESSPPPGNYK